MAADTQEQIKIVERLQLLWLQRMEKLLTDGLLTSTDAATLYRFMADNGWVLDPAKLPSNLKDKLESTGVKFEEDTEFGMSVLR